VEKLVKIYRLEEDWRMTKLIFGNYVLRMEDVRIFDQDHLCLTVRFGIIDDDLQVHNQELRGSLVT
jgi:hypothetical protein